MSQRLIFADAPAAADALTFAGRSARVGDGAVRLAAAGGTLTMTAAPFAPRGLFDATPTVLAMRALPVDPAAGPTMAPPPPTWPPVLNSRASFHDFAPVARSGLRRPPYWCW